MDVAEQRFFFPSFKNLLLQLRTFAQIFWKLTVTLFHPSIHVGSMPILPSGCLAYILGKSAVHRRATQRDNHQHWRPQLKSPVNPPCVSLGLWEEAGDPTTTTHHWLNWCWTHPMGLQRKQYVSICHRLKWKVLPQKCIITTQNASIRKTSNFSLTLDFSANHRRQRGRAT